MFTGLIQAIGHIQSVETRGGDVRLRIGSGSLSLDGVSEGDSIAVSGVCLTALDLAADSFAADVSVETLEHTTLGACRRGDAVNLERSLTLATPLGGHFVSGHVDGVGRVRSITDEARSQRWVFEIPPDLRRFVASKGSIAVNGVSLTVNELYEEGFGVNLIPHTQEATTFSQRRVGDAVNIEVDRMARYAERLIEFRDAETQPL